MGLALVQDDDSGAWEYSSHFVSLPANATIGNCVVMCVIAQAATPNWVEGVSGGGTWVKICSYQVGALYDIEWWACLDITEAFGSFTVFGPEGGMFKAYVAEYSGRVGSITSGGDAQGAGGTASMAITNAIGSAVLAAIECAAITAGPSSPWTDYDAGYFRWANGSDIALQITTAASVTPSWTVSGSTAWALLGLILTIATPGAPTLVSPANASTQDVSAGQEFTATYNASVGDSQNAYAMRIKISSGSYQYWNATTNALQSGIVWNADVVAPGGSFGPTLPPGAVTDGNTYNWSIASQDAVSGAQGVFATDFVFNSLAIPTIIDISAPTGTVTGTSQPTVLWTANPAPGASQVTYQVVVESGSYGTSPGEGTPAWTSGVVVSTAASVEIGTPLTSGTTYRVFVQISETGGLLSAWAYSTFTPVLDVPATPIITATPSTDPVTGLPMIELSIQALDNYMTANDSSFEGGGSGSVGSWVPGANTTITPSDAEADDGEWSLALTSSAAGAESATSGFYSVAQGIEYRFMAALRAATVARAWALSVVWYNVATVISTVTVGTANDSTTGWSGISGILSAPAGATQVTVTVSVAATAGGGEVHYLDCAGIFPGSVYQLLSGGNASTASFAATISGGNASSTESELISGGSATSFGWTLGGYVGMTSLVVLRSDGVYVRWASQANPLTVPSVGEMATVYDYEAIPGAEYTYTVTTVIASPALSSGQSTPSAQVSLTTTGWWEFNPLSGGPTSNPTAVNANMIDWAPVSTEQSTANPVINQPTMNIVANTIMNQDFSATAETFASAVYAAFNALLTGQATVFISSPWGSADSGYFRIGPESGGQSSGSGTTAKTTTLLASTATAPHRTVAITAVSQQRPPV